MFGSDAYLGSFSLRSVVTIAGIVRKCLKSTINFSSNLDGTISISTSDAKVPCGSSSNAASICQSDLNHHLSLFPKIIKSGFSFPTTSFKAATPSGSITSFVSTNIALSAPNAKQVRSCS